nr:hypothetical protein [uncultured Mediterranean phage uvMED]
MAIVKDEELLKELNAIVQKKQVEEDYNIKDGVIVNDKQTIDALNSLKNQKEEKQIEKDTFFQNIINTVSNVVTGNNRTEFEGMSEIYEAKTKNLTKDVILNIGYIANIDQMAQLDMITKQYPGTVVSKDKFDNIMVTLPNGIVKDGNDRTFYLDKPGLSFNGTVNALGQALLYIPGAGWVSKNVTSGAVKKITAQGFVAAGTSVATDVISASIGSQQGDGMIPVVEESKALTALIGGAVAEKAGQFLSTFTGFKAIKDGVKSIIPSRFNVLSKSGLFFDNKGKITNKTIDIAKKLNTPEKVLNNESLMLDFAKALESGLDPYTAKNMVGLNEFGVSVWLAQAQGNKQVLSKIQLMRDGAYGDEIQKVVLDQDDKQLKAVFNYLKEYRNNLIKNKNSTPLEAPPGTPQKVANELNENIDEITLLLRQTEKKMKERVNAKYDAIKTTQKLSFDKPILKNFTYWINKDLMDVDTGIGQALDKTLMPQSSILMKRLNGFMGKLENKNLSKITVGMLETERKAINKMLGNAQGVDKAAMMVIKKRYDTFYENALEKGLKSGSKEVLEAYQKARLENTNFMKVFSPQHIIKNGVRQNDMGTKVIRNIIDGEYSGTQIANWLYGSASLGKATKEQSIQTIKKLNTIFKDGSDGRQLIKDGAFLRIVENSFKKIGSREVFDPEKFILNVKNSFDGKGKDISKLIFNDKEMKTLIKFAEKVEKDLPRKVFASKDGGADAFTNIWNSFMRSALGIGAFNIGGIQATLAARFGFDAVAKQSLKNQSLKEMQEAIFKLNLPEATGGAGLIDQTKEKVEMMNNPNVTYNGRTIPNASTLEQLKVIESLNSYR